MDKYLVGAILFFIVVDVFIGLYFFYKRKKLSSTDKKKFISHWKRISDMRDYHAAIFESDKLIDEVLFKMGYKGSLGDKLKKSEKLFSDYNGLWSAHKFRNRMAHELGFAFNVNQAKQALRQYEKSLKDLKVL